jgi:hypothetical protein
MKLMLALAYKLQGVNRAKLPAALQQLLQLLPDSVAPSVSQGATETEKAADAAVNELIGMKP